MSQVTESALQSALREWTEATDAYEASPSAEKNQRMEDAQSAYQSARAQHERREALEEAKRNLPAGIAPVGAVDDEPATRSGGGARVKRETLTYSRGGSQSFFLDSYRAQKGDKQAEANLQRHVVEMTTEGFIPDAEARAIAETAGSGGELVEVTAP